MTKLTSTPAGAVLVAIDMSKSRQEVLIERPEGGRRRRMTVMATRQDYDGFAEQLAAIGRPIIVGFEATGNYHRTLAHRLLTAGFELRLISSVALARTREALHNGWDGTVRNFVREAIGWNGRDHRYGNRQGRFGPASGWP